MHWTHRELLAEMPLPWTVGDSGRDMSVLYPSLVDPDSTDPDFTTTDLQAYVYFTRHNGGQGLSTGTWCAFRWSSSSTASRGCG